MKIDSVFYSETMDDLYRVKNDIANKYNSLTEFCIHLKDVESMMRKNGVTFLGMKVYTKCLAMVASKGRED